MIEGLYRVRKRVLSFALLWCVATSGFALSACGGGGSLPFGSVVNSPGGGGGSGPPTQLVKVNVQITVPAGDRIGPDYVSVNTKSLTIELTGVDGKGVTGVSATTIETSAHGHNCKTVSGGTLCTGTATGSPGQDVFSVTTYSAG
ncbi:MAG TPA: hypothetical protein VMU38_05135, partial [Candidatus Binatia bacterium]|nr:hypothetical protein [Candidatus Binatia bacterium]